MAAADLLHWLETSALADYIRQAPLFFPVVEIVHITGFTVLVGSAFLFDLRLLGVSRHIPVTTLAQHLLPWSRRSLLLVIPSGILLFISQAKTLGASTVFLTKLILILAAFANAAIFHRYTFRSVAQWDHSARTPAAVKAAGILSLLLWASVITCGRLIAYL
jgi:hypothetical protein